MKIFGEELGNIGRWYIALPPLLLLGFLIGLFFLAADGQSRLTAADERVHSSEIRERALNEFLAAVTDAESEQRGYLLTGEESYRQLFTAAAAQIEPMLGRLDDAYSSLPAPPREIPRLRELTARKLKELEQTIDLYQQGNIAPATGIARTNAGKQTTEDILGIVAVLRDK